ncbi:MAG TPA: SRPBCC domain-containing protein [Candidatus Saccharimonadales bacterium]|nr:SRPBCC domain-containing protein [Candidatus Saccharimonadales bacterium]
MAKTKFEVDKDNLEVRITRVYNATPQRLWRAYTDPEEVAQWWRNTTIDKFELKVGGAWRFVDHGKNGDEEHGFHGEFKEIDEPRKIVRTFEYEPWAGHVMTESVIFEPQGESQTLVTTVSKYANLDDLEGMVQSGMEKGATAGLERIAALVEQ